MSGLSATSSHREAMGEGEFLIRTNGVPVSPVTHRIPWDSGALCHVPGAKTNVITKDAATTSVI